MVDKILDDLLDLTFTNVKNRTCNICNKILVSTKYLKEHIENHFLPTEIECAICLKMFSQHSLNNHMKKHTGARIEDGQGNFLKLDIPQEKKKTDNFMECFDYLKFTYGTSKTVKIHTIESHLVDYVKVTSKTLGSLDQCIEAVHQYFNQRMNASNYKIKNKSSEKHGDKLLQLVNHFNSYNLYN